MLDSIYTSALRVIYDTLYDKSFLWALTGSTAFIIQGLALTPHDIDIQTDKAGAYTINELLKDYETEPISFSSTDVIRSYFGRFRINGVSVEVMGDIQKKHNNAWEDIVDLRPLIEYAVYDDMTLPVLDLNYESSAYRKLGRANRANEIDRFLQTKR